MSRIALYNSSTGALEMIRNAAGYAAGTEKAGLVAIAVPAGFPADARWDVATRSFLAGEDPAKAEAETIAAVKAEGERLRMIVLSPGGSK